MAAAPAPAPSRVARPLPRHLLFGGCRSPHGPGRSGAARAGRSAGRRAGTQRPQPAASMAASSDSLRHVTPARCAMLQFRAEHQPLYGSRSRSSALDREHMHCWKRESVSATQQARPGPDTGLALPALARLQNKLFCSCTALQPANLSTQASMLSGAQTRRSPLYPSKTATTSRQALVPPRSSAFCPVLSTQQSVARASRSSSTEGGGGRGLPAKPMA